MRRAAALLSLVVLAGCGGGPETADVPARTTSAPPAASASPRATASPTATAVAPAGAATPEPVRASGRARVETVASGLTVPWDVAFLPDGRALVTERPGRVRVVSSRGRLQGTPVARVRVAAQGEGGLLGIAVDPAFASGRRFVYLQATVDGQVKVLRYRVGDGARLTRAATILDGVVAGSIHDSGRLRFGPDGHLYVATGDAGEGARSQDRGGRNGKILRLTPGQYRGGRPAARPAVHALGLRNPQGLAWQPGSGRLFATDHGPSGFDGASGDDEVNRIRRGANYGWPRVRGSGHGGYARPAHVWRATIAPSGAAFLASAGSSWTGDLFVAALKGTSLRRLSVTGARVTGEQALFRGRFGRLRAVVEAPDGTLWLTTSNRDGYGAPVSGSDDRILRVIPPRS